MKRKYKVTVEVTEDVPKDWKSPLTTGHIRQAIESIDDILGVTFKVVRNSMTQVKAKKRNSKNDT